MENKNLLKASSKSVPGSIAGAIMARLKEYGYAEVQCIGAASLNQGTKAAIIATGHAAEQGIELIIKPIWATTVVEDATAKGGKRETTAIKLVIEPR